MTIAETLQPSLEAPDASGMVALPGFTRGEDGRPRIGLEAESLYARGGSALVWRLRPSAEESIENYRRGLDREFLRKDFGSDSSRFDQSHLVAMLSIEVHFSTVGLEYLRNQ